MLRVEFQKGRSNQLVQRERLGKLEREKLKRADGRKGKLTEGRRDGEFMETQLTSVNDDE